MNAPPPLLAAALDVVLGVKGGPRSNSGSRAPGGGATGVVVVVVAVAEGDTATPGGVHSGSPVRDGRGEKEKEPATERPLPPEPGIG